MTQLADWIWNPDTGRINGTVFNDSKKRFADGDRISTSPIVSIAAVPHIDAYMAVTRSGSVYELRTIAPVAVEDPPRHAGLDQAA